MLIFGSLFGKVWRVWRIAGNTKLSKSVKVTEVIAPNIISPHSIAY